MQLAHLLRQRGLITHRRRHAPQQSGHFTARLHKAEDVVYEKQHVLVLDVAEIFRHGQSRQRHAHAHAGRFVHLSEDQRRFVRHAALVHLRPQLVALARALAHAREHGITAVLGGNVVDKFLDKHGFAHAGAAEQAHLAALGVRLQKVDGFDARFQDLHRRALLAERGRGAVNARALLRFHLALAVYWLTEHVEHAPERGFSHRHLYAVAGGGDAHAAPQPFAAGEHDAAHAALVQMLGDFHHLYTAFVLHFKRVFQLGERVLEHHVHNGTGNACYYAFFHLLIPFFIAFAPEVTSVISCVMAACLLLLYSRESLPNISSALSLAALIAAMRAFCSLQKLSTNAP